MCTIAALTNFLLFFGKRRKFFAVLLFAFAALFLTGTAHAALSGSGTSNDPYLISSAADWEEFVSFCNDNEANHEGNFFKLTQDIIVEGGYSPSRSNGDKVIVGNFCGTFDGGNHTLTFNFQNTLHEYIAPFFDIRGAAFKNLKVAGTISTSKEYTGDIAGRSLGSNAFENCTVSATINSSISSAGNHGDFVGRNQGTLTFTNCVFSGQLLGAWTCFCGGFVGENGDDRDDSSSFGDIPVSRTACLLLQALP